VLSSVSPLDGGVSVALPATRWTVSPSLRGRLQAVRRRRLVTRMRDWLGITVIAGVSVTLFAVTLFSLLGR
jgi:hypothetical protein